MRQSSLVFVTYYRPRKLTIVFCDTYCELLKTVNISYHLLPFIVPNKLYERDNSLCLIDCVTNNFSEQNQDGEC